MHNVIDRYISDYLKSARVAHFRGVMPIETKHMPPQIFEPSGFWMQLPKDKK